MKQRKTTIKLLAVIGCILLGSGVLLAGAGFVGMGFSLNAFTHPKGGKVVQETIGYGTIPKQIDINFSMGNVIIQGDKTLDEVEVKASSNVYEIYMEFGTLVVKANDSFMGDNFGAWKWYQLLNLYPSGNYDVTISLPQASLESVMAYSHLGSVEVSNLQVKNLSATASSGNIAVTDVSQSDSMKLSTSMGTVHLENCAGGDLTLYNDMGNMAMEDCQFETGELVGSSGTIQMWDSTWETLTVENDLGDCLLENITANETVTCTTSMGNVELTKLSSPKIHLEADSGNVSGSILGKQEEYRISQETDMGDSNLKDQLNGIYTLEVATDMGNIHLEFTQ